MKKLLIKVIKLYQNTPGQFHSYCRHIPTCSEYSIIAIDRFGVIKGGYLAFKRILRCNPWGTKGIDLVPERKKNEKN
ncbi:MAG: membrane protein insertion efficiency factor YidD [Bacilli bacterium]|nr:membrane protein insertion efficiency factor YidD [Bacilli bacterium]